MATLYVAYITHPLLSYTQQSGADTIQNYTDALYITPVAGLGESPAWAQQFYQSIYNTNSQISEPYSTVTSTGSGTLSLQTNNYLLFMPQLAPDRNDYGAVNNVSLEISTVATSITFIPSGITKSIIQYQYNFFSIPAGTTSLSVSMNLSGIQGFNSSKVYYSYNLTIPVQYGFPGKTGIDNIALANFNSVGLQITDFNSGSYNSIVSTYPANTNEHATWYTNSQGPAVCIVGDGSLAVTINQSGKYTTLSRDQIALNYSYDATYNPSANTGTAPTFNSYAVPAFWNNVYPGPNQLIGNLTLDIVYTTNSSIDNKIYLYTN